MCLQDGEAEVIPTIKEIDGKYWYCCPQGHKTPQLVESESTIKQAPIYCKHCKKSYYPNIINGREQPNT